jgi:RND family efflux transporter MFP subunit
MVFGLFILAGIAAACAGIAAIAPDGSSQDDLLIYYPVRPTDMDITVTERGNLESQQNVTILCEVDDIQGDGILGTPILWIVPNGSSVRKDDLLVELDAAPHQERLDRQILDTDRARAVQIQAAAKYENQQTQNMTLKAEAELDVELAELELEMFTDEESGTHKLEVEAIERQVEDINNEILAAQANLELKRNERRGIESLFKMGYAGKSELERSHLEFLQAESQYTAKINRLTTELANLKNKRTYERQMELLKLQGKLQTNRRLLIQVERDSQAKLAQAKAALDAADLALAKEEERLVRYREDVKQCKIFAPQDGMVAYTPPNIRYRIEEMREGTPVRPRQSILSLPNLTTMQVKTAVHESVVDQIETGMKATVHVDAFPDRVYSGSVRSVAVLPDQGSYFQDTKTYETIVTIDQEVEQLKPGMTAVVEIHVSHLQDALAVPVQAIVQVEDKTWCYVEVNGRPERRPVTLGSTNDKFVELLSGISPDDRVVLNPMAIMAETKDDQPEAVDGEQGAAD